MMKSSKGFTLTEMLVVVMVIAVLSAIVYPLYTKASTKSRAIEAINLLQMVRNKQLKKFASTRSYYTSFDNMGQLTSNKNNEVISGNVLKVNDYTLSLNNVKSCMTATYEKGRTIFTFSSSYESTGLGCTGDVCSSFGNIVGTAKDVCNCGSKTCNNGYTLDEDTCDCDCYLGCDQGGTCFAPYGGGQTRACASGCGTQNSSASCSGPVWTGSCSSPTQTQATSMACTSGCGMQTRTCTATCSGGTCSGWDTSACSAPTQTQPTSQSCGNSGTQTRTCTATCSGGTCGSWGACTGQTCPSSTKPATSQNCTNCGTQTRTVTCDTASATWTTGSWGACTGTKTESATCDNDYVGMKTRTCTDNVWGEWDSSGCAAPSLDCTSAKPASTQTCGNCGSQTRTVSCDNTTGNWTTDSWSTCSGEGTCAVGATQSCGGGNGTQTCSSSCAWNSCACKSGYNWNGSTCVKAVTPKTYTTSNAVAYCKDSDDYNCYETAYYLCASEPTLVNKESGTKCSTYTNCVSSSYKVYYSGSGEYTCASPSSLPTCSGSNYQDICTAKGTGYKCLISGSGTVGGTLVTFYCGTCMSSSGSRCCTANYHGTETSSSPIDWDAFVFIDIGYGAASVTYLQCE